jgi:hypothetical protein
MHNDLPKLIEAGTALTLIGLASIPAISGFVAQLRSRHLREVPYEDEDGKSTPESATAFSNKRPKIAITIFSSIGCLTSIALSIIGASKTGKDGLFLQNWLTTTAWVSTNIVTCTHTLEWHPKCAYIRRNL